MVTERSVRAALLSLMLLTAASVTGAQPCAPALRGGMQLESERYALVFRSQPEKIVVGSHFAVEFVVCPKRDAQLPQGVRVDAQMPAHRHGMNYAAQVTAMPDGRYLAEGLMFHMPGRWEFVFDLRAGGKTDRLRTSVLLE